METTQPSGRNLWPYAIIGFFVVFVSVTVGLVVLSVRNRSELVSTDYYEQELRYQGRMDSASRADAQRTPVAISYETNLHRLTLTLPAEHAALKPTGTVMFYRPSSAGLDHETPLNVDAQGRQQLDTAKLQPGLWKLRINWKAGESEFSHDQGVVVAKPVPGA